MVSLFAGAFICVLNTRVPFQVAMRLLEKDIHDKQDTLISLRRQLEDVKKLNLELHNKLQVKFLLPNRFAHRKLL